MRHIGKFTDSPFPFDEVREAYERARPTIMAARDHWTSPHFCDWDKLLTPIEMQMWSLIRCQPIPFYPQFPVGRKFVDFGNPVHRVAIECDGREWHAGRAEKDMERDRYLYRRGWLVARFTGADCLRLHRLPDVIGAAREFRQFNIDAPTNLTCFFGLVPDDPDAEERRELAAEEGWA